MTAEREALARIIWEQSIAFSNPGRDRATEWGDVRVSAARQQARYLADAILTAGFSRQEPRPVTDAEVEAAWRAWFSIDPDRALMGRAIGEYRTRARAALEAARGVTS